MPEQISTTQGDGLERAAVPIEVLVEFDLRVIEIPFRSRNSMINEAVRHFLVCPNADWESGDHPAMPA